MLVVLEQFLCQAHGPASVVSDRAIYNFDLQHGCLHNFERLYHRQKESFGHKAAVIVFSVLQRACQGGLVKVRYS